MEQLFFCLMIDTKLILIEGIPGSGKSTTAKIISGVIAGSGIQSQCYLEWSENHPIFIGRVDDLSEIISSSKSREVSILKRWNEFVRRAKQNSMVYIMESRFWQSDAMYLFLSGQTEDDIVAHNKRIVSELPDLNPALIFLTPANIKQHLITTATIKNKKWQESGRDGSWEEWGDRLYERQKWFSDHSIRGQDAFLQFFSEWLSIADRLYEIFPFRKTKIRFNHVNWDLVMEKIKQFLDLHGEVENKHMHMEK